MLAYVDDLVRLEEDKEDQVEAPREECDSDRRESDSAYLVMISVYCSWKKEGGRQNNLDNKVHNHD